MKKIVFFIILIVILFAVPITVYLMGQQQELRTKAAPATVLALNPTTITKTRGDIFSFEVQIDTGGNNVAIAELHLMYDPVKLEALSITNGPLAPKIAASGVVGGGTASITVRAENTTKPITGSGTIAIIRFRAIAVTESPTQVKFDTTTYVSGLGEDTPNVLTNTIPATVQVTQAQPEIAPTASSSATLPITPTPTIESTQSAEATSSAIDVFVQTEESGISPNTPYIQGKAPPGSTVTIVIHSDPITVVVTTDEDGIYRYTPEQPLADGAHTIIVTSQNADGTANTASSEFTVSASASGSVVGDAMPTSGNTTYTLLLIVVAAMIVMGGIVLL